MYDDLIDEYIEKVLENVGAQERGVASKKLRAHLLAVAEAIATEKKTPIDALVIREAISKVAAKETIAALYPARASSPKEHRSRESIRDLGSVTVAFLIVAVVVRLVAPEVLAVPLAIIMTVVFALTIAMIVIAGIALVRQGYEWAMRRSCGSRLHGLGASLGNPTSPWRAWLTIALVVVGSSIMMIEWPRIPFLASFDGGGRMIPLLTAEFANLLPYVALLGVFNIANQLLYLFARQTRVPNALDVMLSSCTALLWVRIFAVFPFNPELAPTIAAGIKVLLILAAIGSVFEAAKKARRAATGLLLRLG